MATRSRSRDTMCSSCSGRSRTCSTALARYFEPGTACSARPARRPIPTRSMPGRSTATLRTSAGASATALAALISSDLTPRRRRSLAGAPRSTSWVIASARSAALVWACSSLTISWRAIRSTSVSICTTRTGTTSRPRATAAW